jgi:hypothetical protein
MKALTAGILGLGGLLIYSLFRKGKALGNLIFFPYSIKNIRFQGATPILSLGITVQNTSNQSFTLKSIAGELFANNYLIGNLSQFTPLTINPNSEVVMYVDCRLSLLSIVGDIVNAIKTGAWSQNLELECMANVDNLQVPINITYKFGK